MVILELAGAILLVAVALLARELGTASDWRRIRPK
jgi:hypothetical protein